MAILRQFCCCFNIRNGSIFCGVYSLITSAVFIGLLVVRYVGYKIVDSSPAYSVAIFSTVALFGVDLLLAIFLIIGVHKDIKALILPWIVFTVTCVFEGSGVLCWLLVTRMRSLGDILPWEAGITAFHLCNSILLIYCLLCVISQLQDLIAGKGTARDYRRRRQRRRLRELGLANEFYVRDLEAINGLPPIGPGGPGPVIEAPPYAEKPPPYERADSQINLIDSSENMDPTAVCSSNTNINIIDGEIYEASTSSANAACSSNSNIHTVDSQLEEARANNALSIGNNNINPAVNMQQSHHQHYTEDDRNDGFTARLDFSSDINSFEHSEGEEFYGASGGNIINTESQRNVSDNHPTHVFVPYPVIVLPQDVPSELLPPEAIPTTSNYVHPYEPPSTSMTYNHSRQHRPMENNERNDQQRRRTKSQRNKPKTRRNSEHSRRRRTPSVHADFIRSTVHSIDQHGRVTNLSQDMFSENLHSSPHFQRDNPVLLNPNHIVPRPSVHPVYHNAMESHSQMQTFPPMQSLA